MADATYPRVADRNIIPPNASDIPITFRIKRSAAEWITFATSAAGVVGLAYVTARGTWLVLALDVFTDARLHPLAAPWLSGFVCCGVLASLTWIISKVTQ